MATDNDKLKSKTIKIKDEQTINNLINNSNNMKFASFSFPRDLTLGGSGVIRNQQNTTAKKVFTPNLNVTRNKKTNVKTSSSPNVSSRGRGKYDKNKSNMGQGRGGGRNNNLIQTAGVFSEGVGGAIRKNSSSSSSTLVSNYSRSESSTRQGNVRQGKIIDSKQSKNILSDSSDNDDNNDDDVNAINDLENVPIKLLNKNNECTVADKNDRYNGPSKISLNDLFSKEQKKLFLMQLPDCLPHQTLTEEKNKDSETSSENQCFLKSLQEGQIGKLLRYKSGKYKLVLGNTFFDLEFGMEPGFLQEVVSISTNQEERSGDIIDLGEIQTKINIVPDWEQLIKNSS